MLFISYHYKHKDVRENIYKVFFKFVELFLHCHRMMQSAQKQWLHRNYESCSMLITSCYYFLFIPQQKCTL